MTAWEFENEALRLLKAKGIGCFNILVCDTGVYCYFGTHPLICAYTFRDPASFNHGVMGERFQRFKAQLPRIVKRLKIVEMTFKITETP